MDVDKIVYSINVEDIQKVAEEQLGTFPCFNGKNCLRKCHSTLTPFLLFLFKRVDIFQHRHVLKRRNCHLQYRIRHLPLPRNPKR